MGRRKQGAPPSYRLHRQSGQAVVSLPKGNGAYEDVLLAEHGSPESHAEYTRVIAAGMPMASVWWPVRRHRIRLSMKCSPRFGSTRKPDYRHPSGEPTSEVENLRLILHRLRRQYWRHHCR